MTDVRAGQLRQRAAVFARTCARALARGLLCLSMVAFLVATPPAPPARAECSNCFAVIAAHTATVGFIILMHQLTRFLINQAIELFKREYMIGVVFEEWILPGLQDLTNQLTAAGMGQVMMIGAFMDAREQLERQMLLQELTARAHKDYHPSTQMCAIGTSARGLGSAAANAELATFALSQRSQDRQLHNANVNAAEGKASDENNRLALFMARYCDAYDNNYEAGIGGGLTAFCSNAKPANNKWATNRDVETGRLFNTAVYKARYDNATVQQDDPDLFALASNLYAHRIMDPVPEAMLTGQTNADIAGNQDILLDIRSIVAKRSVAEDSFNHIAGMRTLDSDGAAAASPYMAVLLRAMGYAADDAAMAVDAYPSYDARMELLTKKIYMEPEFYTNLYDKPANVARTKAAMRAIGLAQDMDALKSRLRNEMSLSILLELEIEKEQERVNNRLKDLRAQE